MQPILTSRVQAHLQRQVVPSIRHTVLKVVREQDLDRLRPQSRLGSLDVLRQVRLALPVENVGKLALRQCLSVGQRCPNKVLQLGEAFGDVDDPLALLKLDLGGHALPEVRHGVDDVGVFESALQALGITQVGLDDFHALLGQGFALLGGSIPGQTAHMVLRRLLQEVLNDRPTLRENVSPSSFAMELLVLCKPEHAVGKWHYLLAGSSKYSDYLLRLSHCCA